MSRVNRITVKVTCTAVAAPFFRLLRAVVACLAQALKLALEEHGMVATVRHNMVGHLGWCDPTHRFTETAEIVSANLSKA